MAVVMGLAGDCSALCASLILRCRFGFSALVGLSRGDIGGIGVGGTGKGPSGGGSGGGGRAVMLSREAIFSYCHL